MEQMKKESEEPDIKIEDLKKNDFVSESLIVESEPKLIQKFIWVFSDPYKLGSVLQNNSKWILPILINVILVLPMQFLILPQTQIKIEEQIIKSFENRDTRISSEQQEEIISQAKQVGKLTTPLFGSLVIPLMILVTALFWLVVGNLIMGGEAKFKILYTVIAWTFLIVTIGGWIKVPFIILQNTLDIPLGPAVFLPEGSTGFLFSFLNGFDFFYVWQTIALGIAVSAIYHWSKAKGILVSVFLLFFYITIVSSFSIFG